MVMSAHLKNFEVQYLSNQASDHPVSFVSFAHLFTLFHSHFVSVNHFNRHQFFFTNKQYIKILKLMQNERNRKSIFGKDEILVKL